MPDWNCCQIAYRTSSQQSGSGEPVRDRAAEEAQYQPSGSQDRDGELMLRVGALLGMVYIAFLAVWIWATRLRPH